MKIESIKIENFGKINNLSLSLEKGLNVFKEDNGWGKSTLTAFIRVMFYGFEGEGKQKAYYNERLKYKPWQGGIYGGNITFETKGRRYVLTRQFATKKNDDIFELRDADTNLVSNDFTDEIGKELFHINSESFMKTVFIGQNDCSSADSTDDINSRIGNISDSTDMNKYKAADSILSAAINKLADSRSGERKTVKNAITSLQTQVNAGRNIEKSLEEINRRLENVEIALEELTVEQNALNARRNKIQGIAAVLQAKADYAELQSEVEKKRSICDSEKKWFPCDVPTRERLEEWEKYQDNMNSAVSVAQNITMTEAENEELSKLSAHFVKNGPDEIINSAMQDKASELNRLRMANKEVSMSGQELDKMSLYGRMFENCPEPVRTLNTVSEDYNKALQLTERAQLMQQELNLLSGKYSSSKKRSRVFLVLGLLAGLIFAALGGTSFVPAVKEKVFSDFSQEIVMVIGILLLVIGVCLIIITVVAELLNGNLKRDEELLEGRRRTIYNAKTEADKILGDINRFLISNRFMNEGGDIPTTLQKLINNAFEYKNLKERYEKFAVNDNSAACDELSRNIKNYLADYGISAEELDYSSRISYLGSVMKRYIQLSEKKERAEQYTKKSALSVEEFSEQLKLFGFNTECDLNKLFVEIRQHLQLYSDASNLLSDAIMRLKRFENTNDMEAIRAELSEADYITSDEIEAGQQLIDKRKTELEAAKKTDISNLEELEERYEDYLENLRLLEENRARYEELSEMSDQISKAQYYLTKARENMTSRYVTPLKNGFDKYFGMFTDESPEDYMLDANLDLKKNESGMLREKEYLSCGYKDLLGFCMRLSMADTMYKGDKPVLILDDPFVNLDDDKMKSAMSMLEKTSGEYQIVYMTCRDERV